MLLRNYFLILSELQQKWDSKDGTDKQLKKRQGSTGQIINHKKELFVNNISNFLN